MAAMKTTTNEIREKIEHERVTFSPDVMSQELVAEHTHEGCN
jgi:hypothetical protein